MELSLEKIEKQTNALSDSEQLAELYKNKRFHGVQIHRCNCKAGSFLAGQVFTFKTVPCLPVEGCDAPACTCEYLGVTNRRWNADRRSGVDRRCEIRKSVDRRVIPDRRLKPDTWKGFDR